MSDLVLRLLWYEWLKMVCSAITDPMRADLLGLSGWRVLCAIIRTMQEVSVSTVSRQQQVQQCARTNNCSKDVNPQHKCQNNLVENIQGHRC